LIVVGKNFPISGRKASPFFNQSSLGKEIGLDNKIISSRMNLLEVSFIALRLKPYYKNFKKRVVKTPKIGFY